MTVSWNIDLGAYLEQLVRQRADAIERDVVALVDGLTDQAAAFMKGNARWQDRSGDARAGLWADTEHAVRQTVNLLMSHDVTLDYTWFLEANPRFAILGDAADHFWPLLLRGATEICRKHSR